MKKTNLGISIAFFLGVFIAGSFHLALGAEPRTFRGKTAQKDAYYVELDSPVNKKARFSLTFIEISGKLNDFFGQVGKVSKDPEVTLVFINVNDAAIAKAHCRLDQFQFGAGGGLSYRGEISADQASRTTKVSVEYQPG